MIEINHKILNLCCLESCQLTSYNISGINLTFNATLPRIRTYSNEKCDNGKKLSVTVAF